MNEKWQELKKTITEMRDNNGTGTQQEVCKFLANLMDVLEKQMQEPCEDAISRQAVEKITWEEPMYTDALNVLTEVRDKVRALPPVNSQEPVLDKIRAEIDEQYDRVHPYNISCAEGLEMALNIIDKYMAEGSEE